MAKANRQLAADIDAELISAVEQLAQTEGRAVDALVAEALADLLAKHAGTPREPVMAAYEASHDRFAELYKKLAK